MFLDANMAMAVLCVGLMSLANPSLGNAVASRTPPTGTIISGSGKFKFRYEPNKLVSGSQAQRRVWFVWLYGVLSSLGYGMRGPHSLESMQC